MENLLQPTFVTLWKTFKVLHILKVQISQSFFKSAEYLFPKVVHASKSFFLVLGSISVTEGITNCMLQAGQMEDKMHLLFFVPLKNFLTTLLKSLSLAYLFFLSF